MKPNLTMIKAFTALSLTLMTTISLYSQPGPAIYNAEQSARLAVAYSTPHTIAPDGFTRTGAHSPVATGLKSSLDTDAPPPVLWTGYYGGTGKDECYSVQPTADGGYILVGRSDSYGAGNFDAWLVKTDAAGAEIWSKSYGDNYIDEAYMVKELSTGGYIVAGMSTAFGWSGEGWLLKTDADGNIVWSFGYHPSVGSSMPSWDYLYDVVEMPDGGFIAVGTANDNYMSTQGWIMRVDAAGTMLWDHMYGGEFWERFFALSTTSDGGVIAAGDRHWTYNDTTYRHDGWLLKFNDLGDTTWTQHFGSEGHDIFRSVKQISGGGYILCGERQEGVETSFMGWMVKTDANGNALWNNTFSKGGLYAVSQVANGCFAAAGIYFPQGAACEGLLLKTDGTGNVAWESFINGTDLDDMFLGMAPTADGGYVMGGKYNSDGAVCDYWLVKTDAEPLEPLTYFYEDFDAVATPALPESWSALVDKLLSNTVAEVRTMEQGSTTSLPNAVFIMNGLDGSNGQLDTTAFVSLITPWVLVGNTGATLTFYANGGNAIQVGTLSDPLDPATFSLVQEITLEFNFTQYTVTFMNPGTTWIALKHANTNTVMPLFVDDAEFKQIDNVGFPGMTKETLNIFPNPATGIVTVTALEEMQSVTVYNLLGSRIFHASVPTSGVVLDVTGYKPGPYIVRITTTGGTVISKMLNVIE